MIPSTPGPATHNTGVPSLRTTELVFCHLCFSRSWTRQPVAARSADARGDAPLSGEHRAEGAPRRPRAALHPHREEAPALRRHARRARPPGHDVAGAPGRRQGHRDHPDARRECPLWGQRGISIVPCSRLHGPPWRALALGVVRGVSPQSPFPAQPGTCAGQHEHVSGATRHLRWTTCAARWTAHARMAPDVRPTRRVACGARVGRVRAAVADVPR